MPDNDLSPDDLAPDALLATARDVLQQEARAIASLATQLGAPFLAAAELLRNCRGMVVVTGMGKAGLVGAKISATLASTGTRSYFLHPADAAHGDLGRLDPQDLVVALSFSGTTEEVLRLLEPIRRIGARLVALTGHPESPLARFADLVLDVGKVVEACPLGLAPTTSTSVMLALGDALALTVMRRRNFAPDDFARFHPAGALGRKLLTVGEVMRKGHDAPTVPAGTRLLDAVKAMTDTRAGAVTVVDAKGLAVGFYTDGDLRRNLLQRADHGSVDLGRPLIDDVMTRSPRTIGPGHLATEALHVMKECQLDQILVVDDAGCPAGLLDVQDLLRVGLV
ncbi:MAG: KpsF/GutQ family sugar-phosphate isomerase [Planctomycetes bacterium]|nr:KpsF/GutQ family sugar-phosphate isomerase [Planctomycetota bacterium]